MAFLAFGLFLLLTGIGVALVPAGAVGGVLAAAGWICVGLGATLVIVHVAVGPRRARGGRRA